MKHRPPKAVLVLLPVAVIAAVLVRGRMVRGAEDPDRIAGSGTVEATAIGVAAETSGLIRRFPVDEGDQVKQGDILAELDRSVLEAELKRAEAVTATATALVEELTRGTRPEEIRARRAKLREATAALAGSGLLRETAREAYARPTELTAARDRAAAEAAAAAARVEEAQARLREARNGSREQELAAARAALAAAEAACARADAEQARAQAAVRGAETDVREAEAADADRREATTQTARASAELDGATAQLAAAGARRDLAHAEPRPELRRRLNDEVDAARAQATWTEQELGRTRQLYDAGAVALRQLDQAKAAADSAQARLRAAQSAVADLDAGARDEERREADAAVAAAEAQVRGATDALANAQREERILQTGSRQILERARSALDQAREQHVAAVAAAEVTRAQRDQAQATLELLGAGTRSERIEQAQAAGVAAEAGRRGATDAVEHARAAERDRFGLRSSLQAAEQQFAVSAARVDAAAAELDLAVAGATPERIDAARGELQAARAAVEQVRARLDDTVIRAPRSGTISEVLLREGETVTPGSVVVRMYDLDNLWVRVYLPLRHFSRTVRGQAAQVTCDAAEETRFQGIVQTVSDEAEFTPKNTQTTEERVKQVFWVKVGIGRSEGILKPGMPVDVVIEAPALP